MKKIILAAVAACAVITASDAAMFNGASVGVNLGTSFSHLSARTRVASQSTTKTFGAYGIQFAYDMSKANSYYFGLGLDAMGYTGSAKVNVGTFRVSANPRFSTELDARLGYNFCGNTIAYGLVGGRVVTTHVKSTSPTRSTFTSNHTSFVPVYGAGLATKITNKVSLGIEYRYSEDYKKTIPGTAVTGGIKTKVRSNAVLARATYHF